MPTRHKIPAGMARPRDAAPVAAGPVLPTLASLALASLNFVPHEPAPPKGQAFLYSSLRISLRKMLPAAALAASLVGCATLTESTEQYVMVQTVLDHQQVAGVGCVLTNDSGRWFVTSPGRVRIRKSTKPLAVDCRLNDVYVYDEISPKQNSSRWGNILLTAGAGQFVDRSTGAGFDYPGTLTVLLKRVAPAPPVVAAPAPAPTAPPPKPVESPQPPQLPGGSPIN